MSSPLSSGTRLGRYEIRSKIGEGGMGEVYLADDTQLGRVVALKILPADIAANPLRLPRFIQEARSAAALNHPNIAHVYEIDEDAGHHFIAMEYVDGAQLSDKINGQPLPVNEILKLGIQLADALDEAHKKGITHRDIKPANVMITSRGDGKLLDFGLAKVRPAEQTNSDDATTQFKTAEGVVIGTVMYMSPEQALGQTIDHRSDIFSLGAVLYEMATGRLPFKGATTTETVDRIVRAQPDAISRFNYDVPPELDRIIRKCLEKERDRRYQSARELLVDLENLKRDSTSSATAASGVIAPVRPKKSSGSTIVIAGLVIVVLAAVAIYFYRRPSQSAGNPVIGSIAVLPFANARSDPNVEYFCDGMTESIINSLSRLPHTKVLARTTAFRYKGQSADLQKVGNELGVDALLTGSVAQQGATLTIQVDLVRVADGAELWGGRFNKGLADVFAVQNEIASDVSDALRLKLNSEEQKRVTRRYTDNVEAYQLYLKGLFEVNKFSPEGFQQGAAYYNRAIAIDQNYALAHVGLSEIYQHRGKFWRFCERSVSEGQSGSGQGAGAG